MGFLVFSCLKQKLKNFRNQIREKVADEVVFRRFQGEGVEFFNRTLLTLLRFLMRIFWKTPI